MFVLSFLNASGTLFFSYCTLALVLWFTLGQVTPAARGKLSIADSTSECTDILDIKVYKSLLTRCLSRILPVCWKEQCTGWTKHSPRKKRTVVNDSPNSLLPRQKSGPNIPEQGLFSKATELGEETNRTLLVCCSYLIGELFLLSLT